ncbi:prefoldin subunit 1 isoform X1 [Corythoichthys intestinalis]|uniref:prefoldin subunit 1 isoform X1 n=1 Tax=Corythoichthys intestinalis TaxID=161448 RepID=UPI0025A555F8|nr:prefoldin subunit 1 isoform X1 [Corythoichthys intestinalis]
MFFFFFFFFFYRNDPRAKDPDKKIMQFIRPPFLVKNMPITSVSQQTFGQVMSSKHDGTVVRRSFQHAPNRSHKKSAGFHDHIPMTLTQAFSELQVKMIDTQQKVKLANLQIEQLTHVQKHANLTHAEIDTLGDDTRMYEGVGRMFILQSKEDIARQLQTKQKTAEEKIKELEQKKAYLERSVKEAEDNIREMLLSRRAQ